VTTGLDRRLMRDRAGKILALGLIWGIAVLALLVRAIQLGRL